MTERSLVEPLMTLQEVARVLRCSVRHVYEVLDSIGYIQEGRRRLVAITDLRRYIESNRISA